MKLDLTLRTTLVLLVLAAVFPLFGLAIVGAFVTQSEDMRRTGQSLEFSATFAAASQERMAESARQLLISVANMPELISGTKPACERYFKALTEQLPVYVNIVITNSSGAVVCDSVGSPATVSMADRPHFQRALSTKAFTIGEYAIGRATGQPVITFSLPILDADRNVNAVAIAAVSLAELANVLPVAAPPMGAQLLITDHRGSVLVSYPAGGATIGELPPSPTLKEVFKSPQRGMYQGVSTSGQPQLYAFLPSRDTGDAPFFVAVSADLERIFAPGRNRLAMHFLALAATALLGSWLAWVVGRRSIVLPAANIVKTAALIQGGQLVARATAGSSMVSSEMTQIIEGFNRMAEALEQRQKELTCQLQEARQTERKLRDAQRLGGIGNWEFSLQTQLFWWSDEVSTLFGVPYEAIGHDAASLLQLVHPDDREAFSGLQKRAAANTEFDLEYRIVGPDGRARWMHQRGSLLHDDSGQPSGMAGVLQEVTARKRAEATISSSVELMARTGGLAKVGGWEFLIERELLIYTDEVHRIHEVDATGATSLQTALSFYAPEVRPVIQAALQACIETGAAWELELPLVTARGRHLWVRVKGYALQEKGQTRRILGAIQDVTEQHLAGAHLRMLESAVSRLSDIVVITEVEPQDEPGPRIVFVNDAFERHTGYTREEVLGRSPRLLQGPGTDRTVLDRIRAALQGWQPVQAELINYTKSGQACWVEMDIVPLADKQGAYTHWVGVQRDVTQRKLAEQALRESEQRYSVLFEAAPVPMWVYDTETLRFLTVNQAAVDAYGYSFEEFMQMTVYDIRTPAQARILKDLRAIGALRVKQRWEHRRKDGSVFKCQPLSRAIQFDGRPGEFVLALDMTAQVEAEIKVQEHLYTLQRAADAAQVITSHQSVADTLQEVVDQARGVIGAHQAVVSLGEPGGAQMVQAVSLSDRYSGYGAWHENPTGEGIYAMVCETNRAVRMTQAELEAHPRWRGFGSHRAKHPPMRGWLAVPLIGRNRTNIGLLQLSDRYEGEFTLEDEYVAVEMAHLVSIAIEKAQLFEEVNQLNLGLEQKVAERTLALARQEALFRALSEQAPQVVWTADPKGRITYLNRAWFDLVGGSLKDWAGCRWMRALHPEDLEPVRASWNQALATGTPYTGTRRVRSKSNGYHTMSYRATPVLDEQGATAFWVGIDADITEVTAIEAALRLSNKELEAFSYSVSHDLRSPLNTVDGFSKLLAKHLESDASAKPRHYLSRIQAGVAQMGQLIEDLLSLAQVSRTELRHETVDLSTLARRVLDDWQVRAPERRVSIVIEPGMQAQCDGRLMRVVLENLLGNAWKFTAHAAEATIRFSHAADAAGEPIYFVQDNGAGFDMSYADKLFKPFHRLHAVTEFAGTGIGLATVSRVINRHGGRLWADAAPGRGATFFFTLPRLPLST